MQRVDARGKSHAALACLERKMRRARRLKLNPSKYRLGLVSRLEQSRAVIYHKAVPRRAAHIQVNARSYKEATDKTSTLTGTEIQGLSETITLDPFLGLSI